MPLPSVEPATPPTDCGSPQTTAVAAVHGPQQERQTAARRSGLEPRTDRSPQSRPHGCAGMSASSAMAVRARSRHGGASLHEAKWGKVGDHRASSSACSIKKPVRPPLSSSASSKAASRCPISSPRFCAESIISDLHRLARADLLYQRKAARGRPKEHRTLRLRLSPGFTSPIATPVCLTAAAGMQSPCVNWRGAAD